MSPAMLGASEALAIALQGSARRLAATGVKWRHSLNSAVPTEAPANLEWIESTAIRALRAADALSAMPLAVLRVAEDARRIERLIAQLGSDPVPLLSDEARDQVERLIELTRLEVDAAVQALINPDLHLERMVDDEFALDGWYDQVLGDVLGELRTGDSTHAAQQVLALARVLERISDYAQHVVSVVSETRTAQISATQPDS